MHNYDKYIIDKPLVKDKNWYIFPNTTFSHINSMDCNNTIDGACHENISFNQCIDMCDKSPMCDYGYYISDLPGKNICVPLKKSLANINPAYRLRNKSIYPELNKAQTKVFIDNRKHNFPPEDANTVFFMDNFLIENTETKTLLESSPISHTASNPSNTNTSVMFDKSGDLIVQALQIPPDLDAGVQYVPIRYGDPLVFNIPETNLVIRDDPNDSNKMEWISRSFDLSSNSSYYIEPIMSGKKKGDLVKYSDTFAIYSNISVLGVSETTHIEKLYYSTYEQAKANNKNVTFKFIPKMVGWYCNNDSKCTEISLEKMVVNDKGVGTYDGLAIGRNPHCWGVCKYKIPNQPHLQKFDNYKTNDTDNPSNSTNITIYILPIISVIIMILLLVFKHFK